MELSDNDQMILLDSTWNDHYFSQIEAAKLKGVSITAVIYDIIPVIKPHMFPQRLKDMYNKWFNWVMGQVSGFACISKTVALEVQQEVGRRLGTSAASKLKYGVFHLGSDLDLRSERENIADPLKNAFQTDHLVVLAVGTIEPRKNHKYLLDVFDQLWNAESETRLCIIGGIGWKCADQVDRIRSHPRFGERLFWFDKLDDDGLEFAYSHASALAISSHAEGFGLPIVESLQRGVPVMASDIPVFREIGGDAVAYFDLENPQSLASLVRHLERTGALPGTRPPSEWKWINWKDSAQQLVDCVLSHRI